MRHELRPGVTFTGREQREQVHAAAEPAPPFRAYACKIALQQTSCCPRPGWPVDRCSQRPTREYRRSSSSSRFPCQSPPPLPLGAWWLLALAVLGNITDTGCHSWPTGAWNADVTGAELSPEDILPCSRQRETTSRLLGHAILELSAPSGPSHLHPHAEGTQIADRHHSAELPPWLPRGAKDVGQVFLGTSAELQVAVLFCTLLHHAC